MRLSSSLALLLLTVLGTAACGSDEGAATTTSQTPGAPPYEKDKTVIIGPGGIAAPVATPDGDACVTVAGACVRPQTTCGDGGRADVVVDAKGKVVAVICYPVDGTPTSTVNEAGQASVVGDNKEIIIIDGKDDGVDVTGDVTITGNGVVVYGTDPATSVIGGDLVVEKNNAAVRGVRIKGDVRIDGNNTALVDCVVEGNVTITSNNNVLTSCTIFGKVVVTGNNNTLFYNRISGGLSAEGAQNAVCEDNRSFSDANADGIVATEELGAVLVCGPGGGKDPGGKPGK